MNGETNPSIKRPYRWGEFQGGMSVVAAAVAIIVVAVCYVAGENPPDLAVRIAWQSPFTILTGCLILKRHRYVPRVAYAWLILAFLEVCVGTAVLYRSPPDTTPTLFVDGVRYFIFWGCCAFYYRKRAPEFDREYAESKTEGMAEEPPLEPEIVRNEPTNAAGAENPTNFPSATEHPLTPTHASAAADGLATGDPTRPSRMQKQRLVVIVGVLLIMPPVLALVYFNWLARSEAHPPKRVLLRSSVKWEDILGEGRQEKDDFAERFFLRLSDGNKGCLTVTRNDTEADYKVEIEMTVRYHGEGSWADMSVLKNNGDVVASDVLSGEQGDRKTVAGMLGCRAAVKAWQSICGTPKLPAEWPALAAQ